MKKKLPNIDPNQPITIDLETCDPELKATAPGYVMGLGFVAGIAIAANEGSWYIPIRHAKGENYDENEVVEWLNKILSADTDKVMHNAQYDLGWLRWLGVELKGKIFDTMLAAALLDENRFSYQLDALGKEYFGEGKFEEALAMAVAAEFGETKTHKSVIRLIERNTPEMQAVQKYAPFVEAKERVSQLYDLYPDDIKIRYKVLRNQVDKKGHDTFKLKMSQENIKGLMWAVDPEEMGSYPIQDVDLTRKLYHLFKEMLQEENLTELMELEGELLPVLLEMREYGVRIDMDKAIELDIKYTAKLEELQAKIDKLAGYHINVDEDAPLVRYCEEHNLPYVHTEKGNPSFSSDNIIMDEGGFFETVLEIRKYNKARNTYIRGYIFGSTLNGRLHGQYNQLKADEGGTVTGRLSSSNPNMQNLPSPGKGEIGQEIRSLFLPDEGDDWLCMDYSGQEPRMLVHAVLSVEKAYNRQLGHTDKIEARLLAGSELAEDPKFRGYDADFHTAVSSFCIEEEYRMDGKPTDTEEFNKDVKAFRGKAKSIGLGVMYGSGVKKMADEMTKKGVPMTVEETANIKENIFKNVPFLKSFTELLMNKAKTRGYILTILKRRGRFNQWECPVFDKNEKKKIGPTLFNTRDEAWEFYKKNSDKYQHLGRPQRAFLYKALNKLIQGSSADQTKMAMVTMYKRNDLTKSSLDVYFRRLGKEHVPPKLRIQVHDEINVSKPKHESELWYQDIMEHCLPLQVEVKAEPVVCENWGKAK